MAIVAYETTGTVAGKLVITWAGLTALDEGETITPQGPRSLAGCIQFIGTFGGAVTLEHSNDGITWFPVNDLADAAISATAAGLYEFTTAARYLRIAAATGVSSVTAIMVLRG